MLTANQSRWERELGTFDQTLVSTATPVEIAKSARSAARCSSRPCKHALTVIVTQFYGVPFRGSILSSMRL